MAPLNLAAYRNQFNVAYKDVTRLYLLRHVWKNLIPMLRSQQHDYHDSMVNNWFITCYAETIAVGIRRQAEARDSRATIGSLLRRIEEQARSFTAQNCGFDGIETLPGRDHAWLKFAPSLEDSLDPRRVAKLRRELDGSKDSAVTWVNARVAHMDIRTTEAKIQTTFGDLERGLRGVRAGVMYLYSLFNPNTVLLQVTPTPQDNWFRMFEQPWYMPRTVTPVDPSDDVR